MDNLINILSQIRKRPSVFIGKASLDRLRLFLSGYCMCFRQWDSKPGHNSVDEFWIQFDNYIHQIYNVTTTQPWDYILTFNYLEEETAFNKFFEHLDEFIEQQNK